MSRTTKGKEKTDLTTIAIEKERGRWLVAHHRGKDGEDSFKHGRSISGVISNHMPRAPFSMPSNYSFFYFRFDPFSLLLVICPSASPMSDHWEEGEEVFICEHHASGRPRETWFRIAPLCLPVIAKQRKKLDCLLFYICQAIKKRGGTILLLPFPFTVFRSLKGIEARGGATLEVHSLKVYSRRRCTILHHPNSSAGCGCHKLAPS